MAQEDYDKKFIIFDKQIMSSPQTIPILERTIDLLSLITESPCGLSAKELRLELGIPQASCYRILRTLVQKNILQEQPNGTYHSAYGLARLARSWSELESSLRRIRPFLEELSAKTGLSAKISIREGNCTVVVLRLEMQRLYSITIAVGSKIPFTEAGSAGIMLLASVPEEERAALLKKTDEPLKKTLLRQAAMAHRQGMAHSYGVHHPSIFAVSKLIHIGVPASITLFGWPEDFAGGKKRRHEAALKQSFATFKT